MIKLWLNYGYKGQQMSKNSVACLVGGAVDTLAGTKTDEQRQVPLEEICECHDIMFTIYTNKIK